MLPRVVRAAIASRAPKRERGPRSPTARSVELEMGGERVSGEHLWSRVRAAWAKLGRPPRHLVEAGRPRAEPNDADPDDPALPKEGFSEEALPWLSAVFSFALRLTRGDEDAASDITQETFMKAYRAWDSFERGTNAKSWLFTICRNTFLRDRERPSSRREIPASQVSGGDAPDVDDWLVAGRSDPGASGAGRELFEGLLDDRVVDAIDELPEEFRAVLVLSDLGDLHYGEITEVLDLPLGTVKSRLFRARRRLRERLWDFAQEEGYADGGKDMTGEVP